MKQKKHDAKIRHKLGRWLLQTPNILIDIFNQLKNAAQRGVIDRQALRMLRGVLQVSELHVRDIMVPRAQMITIRQHATIAEILPTIIDSAHSRFPILAKKGDGIIGVLLAKDLLPCLLQAGTINQNIDHLVRPASFIPESKRIDILLEEFRNNRNHLAVVVDEFGTTSGIITIEDVLEEIVGEIEDEHDPNPASNIQKTNSNTYQVRGSTPLKEINQLFATNLQSNQADSIGGLINQKLGHIAQKGEQLKVDTLKIKIISSDDRFIKKIQIKTKTKK